MASLKQKLLVGTGLLATTAILGVAYGVAQLLSEIEVPSADAPNTLDAKEAHRKLASFTSAMEKGQNGFVRLTEGEIASLLHECLTTNTPPPKPTPKPTEGKDLVARLKTLIRPDAWRMTKVRIDLHDQEISFHTWIEQPVLSSKLQLAWERIGTLHSSGQKVRFDLHSMQIGHLPIPASQFEEVQRWLGSSDAPLKPCFDFAAQIPWAELRSNALNRLPEVVLHTLPQTNAPLSTGK